jgi:hypothetical protein
MRVWRVVCLIAFVTVACATGGAGRATARSHVTPRVLKVGWNERKSFEQGFMAFHVSKITVSPNSWSVTASFTNHSQYTISTVPGTTTGRGSGLSILYYVPPSPGAATGGYLALPAQTRRPAVPVLGPGGTWSGVFGARGRLPRKKDLYFGFGWYTGDGLGGGFNWITVHRFRL